MPSIKYSCNPGSTHKILLTLFNEIHVWEVFQLLAARDDKWQALAVIQRLRIALDGGQKLRAEPWVA